MVGQIHVLHVDGESDFVELAATSLERRDDRFTVETTTSADEALRALGEDEYDCLVSSYDMPGQNGLELFESIRTLEPDLPFILFTGNGSEELASEAISTGVTDYLPKEDDPEQFATLANRIVSAVESAHRQATADNSQGRLQALSEAFPDIILYIDEEGRYLDVLAGPESPLLYEEVETLVGKTFHSILPEEVAGRFLDTVQRALETDELQVVEYPLDVQAGQRWFEARVTPVSSSLSTRGVVVWVARDVTDHKEREQMLTALHTAAKEISRASDDDTVYETLIEAAKRIFDFDLVVVDVERDGFLIQEAWTLDFDEGAYYEKTSLEDDDTLAIRAYNRQETILVNDLTECDVTPASSKYRSVLTVPIGKFGTFQAVSTEVGAFDDRDREFAELLVDHAHVKLTQLQDEQQLRERTAELERQNERLDEFASVVSHDLRNPLNTLTLSLDLAKQTDDDAHFDRCLRAVDRMDRLVDSLLTLAREGQRIDECEPVSLENVAVNAWQTVETGAAVLDVQTTQTVDADGTRLTQLFENLFRNTVEHGSTNPHSPTREDAVEHSSASPPSNSQEDALKHDSAVTVRVGDLEGGFFVEDTGQGIPEDERERVFKAGYSTTSDGTGFGLRIVEQVVDAHGWEIRLTDGTDGGARFEILT